MVGDHNRFIAKFLDGHAIGFNLTETPASNC